VGCLPPLDKPGCKRKTQETNSLAVNGRKNWEFELESQWSCINQLNLLPQHTHTRLWLNSRWFMRNLLDCSGWTGLSIDLLYQHSSFTFFIVLLHLFGLGSHNRVAWFFCLGLCELTSGLVRASSWTGFN